jgi:hypothetical protein
MKWRCTGPQPCSFWLMFQIGAAWEFTHPRSGPVAEIKADKIWAGNDYKRE